MADDVIYTEPVYTERANIAIATRADDQETDWSGWKNGWLVILRSRRNLFSRALSTRSANWKRNVTAKSTSLNLKLPSASAPSTCSVPARACACGAPSREDAKYEQHDIVAVNGSSFIALEDSPGQCPGAGWQLLASAGSRGARGFAGPKGERGENAAARGGLQGVSRRSKDLYAVDTHDRWTGSRVAIARTIRAIS